MRWVKQLNWYKHTIMRLSVTNLGVMQLRISPIFPIAIDFSGY